MPHLETTLARFEEAGLGKYVLPEVQKKYMLRPKLCTAFLKISPFASLKSIEEICLEGRSPGFNVKIRYVCFDQL